MVIYQFFIFEQAQPASTDNTVKTNYAINTNKLNMSSYFDEYDVNIGGGRKLKKLKKFNKNNVTNKNKIIINRERNSRYAPKNRRTVDKDWKDFNDSHTTPTQAHWNWDSSFDWEFELNSVICFYYRSDDGYENDDTQYITWLC